MATLVSVAIFVLLSSFDNKCTGLNEIYGYLAQLRQP